MGFFSDFKKILVDFEATIMAEVKEEIETKMAAVQEKPVSEYILPYMNMQNVDGVLKDMDGASLSIDKIDGKSFSEIVNLFNNNYVNKNQSIGLKFINNKIGSHPDYRYYVIPLVKLTAGKGSRKNSWSHTTGSFELMRTNGCCSSQGIVCDIRAMKLYDSESMEFIELHSLPRDSDGNRTYIRPCKFNYNGDLWGGIRIYVSAQARTVFFTGYSTEDINLIQYYDTRDSIVLNTEINDSLEYI